MNMKLIDLYKTLRNNAKGQVTLYRSDWAADRKYLRRKYQEFQNKTVSTIEFIHVSKSTATHLFPIYRDNLDVIRPYLFGQCTPRATLRDYATIFTPSSTTVLDTDIIQHYDGTKVRIIDKKTAWDIFSNAAQYTRPTLVA